LPTIGRSANFGRWRWSPVKLAYEQVPDPTAAKLPDDAATQAPYDTVTPVNIFRFVFDANFGSEIGLLEGGYYFLSKTGDDSTAEFTDIIASQESCMSLRDEHIAELLSSGE